MKQSLKQMVENLGYDSKEEYFESLITEYEVGNLLASAAEFENLCADGKKAFLDYLDKTGKEDVVNFFLPFVR